VINSPVSTFRRRLLCATILWLLFWPVFRYIQLGDITGPKAFFWITGVLNYPVTAALFAFIDGTLAKSKLNRWWVFLASAAIAAASVPLYYDRVGFPLGVFTDAWLF
jgi:hypothetical protein